MEAMQSLQESAVLHAVREEFSVEIARDHDALQEAYRLRHQVYCLERGFEPAEPGSDVETDEFDAHTRHIVVRSRSDHQVVGTVRLILPDLDVPELSFPMQQVCAPGLLDRLPISETAEVSRFALSKVRRAESRASQGLLRLSLVQGLVMLSREVGVTHWCAMMEPSLLRLLTTTAIYFRPLGPLVEHHGLRQPAYNSVDEIFGRMFEEKRSVWNFITDGGRLWPAPDMAPSLHLAPVANSRAPSYPVLAMAG
jgi:N-acyl-L-homoserine lactone synthetase